MAQSATEGILNAVVGPDSGAQNGAAGVQDGVGTAQVHSTRGEGAVPVRVEGEAVVEKKVLDPCAIEAGKLLMIGVMRVRANRAAEAR